MKMMDKFKQIRLKTALEIFVPLFVMEHNWNAEDNYENLFVLKKQYLTNLLVTEKNRLDGYIKGLTIDHNGNETTENNPDNMFILDYENTCFDTKETFDLLFGLLKTNGASTMLASSGPCADVEEDVIYPKFKDLKFAGLEKKDFDELKKYYGMLQLEESKWRRAIPIATKIGLLFYERNLEKTTKRPAFLKKYKLEFDDWLKNDTVANIIYDSLPEEYRGGSGTSVSAASIDSVINAAAMAGSIVGSRSVKNIDSLKKCLRDEKYDIPTDDILTKIIESVQKLEAEDDE